MTLVSTTTWALLATVLSARTGPFDYPGSGFSSFLEPNSSGIGYPPIPLPGYPTYLMNRSTAAYFLGNDTGLNSVRENTAEARFGIVGIGWQLGMRWSKWRHLERWEEQTARAIKAINPDTKVIVSRNVEVGGVFWDHCRPYFENLSLARHSTMFVEGQPGGGGKPACAIGALCNGSWGCGNCGPIMPFDGKPGVPYGQLKFNWSSPQLQNWWLETHIHAAINRTAIDGVHFDCECGNDNGIAKQNMAAFNANALAVFGRHLSMLASAKKMSIAWTAERIQPKSCDADMRALLHYSNDSTQTFQLSYNNRGADFNQTLAAFLILRPAFALLEFGVIGPYECASEPCGCDKHSLPDSQCPFPGKSSGYGPYRWSPLLDLDYGHPLGPPIKDASTGVS